MDLREVLDIGRRQRGAGKQLYQEMIYTMEGDLLLDTKGDYKIQFLEGSLYIDNKKQPDNVSTKYRKFFDEDITIKKEKGHFTITGNDAVEN